MNLRSCRFSPALILAVATLSAVLFAQQDAQVAAKPTLHPTLSFTSYLLSSADRINAVAASKDGSIYVAGVTLKGASQFNVGGRSAGEGNAFVAKLSPDGNRILYLTYLGTAGLDEARAIAVDHAGNVFVAGRTRDKNFPVVAPLQAACKLDGAGACAGTAFVAKVNPDGAIVFATYLGGSGQDEANAIAVDARGNAFVAGSTTSLDFPVENAAQQSARGNGDAFVTAIAADGSRLLFSTYIGGSDADEARGLAIDRSGSVYLTGKTSSLDFPTSNALQARCAGAKSACPGSAFVTKLSADGKAIQYSTYLGGSGGDAGNAIAVDSRGSAYIAGVTSSADFPLQQATQSALAGTSNAFISKLSPEGSALVFSTFLGGSGADQANAIAIDRFRNVVVAGWTYSPDFPMQLALQEGCVREASGGCGYDSFVADLNSSGVGLRFSSYLGGSGADAPRALAVDSQGSAYFAGWTTSRDFPQAKLPQLSSNVKTSQIAGSRKAGGSFVAKVSGLNSDAPTVTCSGGTKNWVGTAGDNLWNTAANWNPAGVPVATDNVCIASTFTNLITIGALAAGNQTIASLVSGAPLQLSSSALTSTGTATFTDLTVIGGTLVLSATTTMNTLTQKGGIIAGAGDISISGLLTWQAGSQCTNTSAGSCSAPATQAVTNANGGISFTGTSALQGRTLNNFGNAAYTNAFSLQLFLAAIVNNKVGAVWDLGNNANVTASGTGNTFNNAGTLIKTSGTGNSLMDAIFQNTGTVQANSGVLQMRGGGDCGSSCPGTWSVGASGNLQFSLGLYLLTGNFTNNSGGVLLFNGATLDFVKAGTTTFTGPLNQTAGIVFGPATLTITGLFTWQGGAMCTNSSAGSCSAPASQAVTNANGGISFTGSPSLQGRTLNNNGTATYTNAFSFQTFLAAIINNPASGIWDLGNNGNITASGNGNLFNNAGTLRKTSGTGNSLVDAKLENTGTVQANSGVILVRGGSDCGSSCPGTWTVGASGALQFPSGLYVLTGDFTNNSGGTLLFNGATFNFVKAGTTTFTGPLNMSAGIVFGPATLNITGLLTWQGGAMCTNSASGSCSAPASQAITNANGGISLTGSPTLQGRTLNNGGTVSYTNAFSLQMFLAAIVNNKVGSVWDLGNNGNVTANGTGNTFNNLGTLKKTAGTGNSLMDAKFENTGAAQSTSGVIQFRGGADCGSSCAGSWTVGSGGTISFTAGIFVLTSDFTNNSGGTLNFNGATMNLVKAGTMTVNGPLNITSGIVFGPATLTITGLLTWQGGAMCTNSSAGTCSAPASQAVTNTNGGISFTGSPTLQGRTLNNPGTVTYTNAFSLQTFLASIINNSASGVWDLSNNGNVTVSGNGNTFNNAGTLRKLTGTGSTFVDTVFNNSGTIQSNSGALGFRGAFTQTAGSTSMGGGSLSFTTAANEQGGVFSGAGTVTGGLSNAGGNLAPGTASTVGTLVFTTTYAQASAAGLVIKVGGAVSGQYDSVTVNGAATLSGPINLVLINGFQPVIGTQFTVMTFASHSGTFSSVTAGWSMSYTATAAIATFNGGGGNPVVTLSPVKLKFATQVVNTVSKPKKVTLSNTGTAPLHITSIASDNAEFTQTNTCPATVNVGANCVITVKFKPSNKGTRTGNIVISDDAAPGTQSIPLSGVGTFLEVIPNPVAFAAQLVNTTSDPLTITLHNVNATTALNISAIALTGANAADFAKATTCDAVAIAPSGTCTFTMTFHPGALGKRAATMKITEDGGGSPLVIKISGSGTNVTLAPSPVAFGAVNVGTSKPLTVTLTNHNASAIAVSTVTIAGTNKNDFTATKDAGCNSVAGNGGTCSITVTFKPTATGSRNGILSVKDNDSGSPQSDNLGGTGQ